MQLSSDFGAVSEQFRSISSADVFQCSYRAILGQLSSSFRRIVEFRAITEQFQSNFGAISGQLSSSFRRIVEFRAVSEQFQSSFRAVSVQSVEMATTAISIISISSHR